MEPSQTYTLEEQLDVMVGLGMDEPVETIIKDYPYLVFVVGRRDREVFVLLGKDFFDEFNVIRLPQRLHETFEQLLFICRLSGNNTFFIEYTGNINNGKPSLMAHGSGFSTYV